MESHFPFSQLLSVVQIFYLFYQKSLKSAELFLNVSRICFDYSLLFNEKIFLVIVNPQAIRVQIGIKMKPEPVLIKSENLKLQH